MGRKVIFVVRVAVAGVFLGAGVLKIWDFKLGQSATPDFNLAIQSYQLIPSPDLVKLLAVYLPWLEVVAALAVFIKRISLGAATALLGMSAVFFGAVGSAWWRGLDIACGCFGKDEISTDYRTLLLRDGALLIACGVIFVAEWRAAAIGEGASRAPASPAPAA